SAFKQLESNDAKGYKELAEYHQARILAVKGDKEKAKELLKSAREKLQTPSNEGPNPFPFLSSLVDGELRKLDPNGIPARVELNSPKGSMTPEELQKKLKKAMEAAGQKGGPDVPH